MSSRQRMIFRYDIWSISLEKLKAESGHGSCVRGLFLDILLINELQGA